MIPPTPHPAIETYIQELHTSSAVSYSHYTLIGLYSAFGKTNVDRWLDEYWAALREYNKKLRRPA